ncbi:MAG: AAA family ATPase [Acidobacteria bacterium]|nr:AAA family ATPase [Acidobacteriota bacterium]
MKTIAFFNNKGGVGKTTLAYHLAHMLPRIGYPTVAVDLDPQANLTCAFFDEDLLEALWEEETATILACVNPILEGTGDIKEPFPLEVAEGLSVIAGDLGLSRFEDRLSASWPRGYEGDPAALRTTSAFHRVIRKAASDVGAAVALLDVGPNLGAINRSALLAADFLVIPLAADLFSLQGLRNLGPTVRDWRQQWQQVQKLVSTKIDLPEGLMTPAGYVVLQHAVRLDRPVRAYGRWLDRIPAVYRESVLGQKPGKIGGGDEDNHCLATLRNFRSLMPMAQDARKPMFDLRPADGAIGSHAQLAHICEVEFRRLAEQIAEACDLIKPT